MKNFALIGVGGYIAPRHLKAIKDTGNNLVSAYDKSDSVGIMDSYFPKTAFFTEQELFDRHNTKMIANGIPLDYISVCTPNYLHDAHIRYGLRLGANVICEKPVVLNPWNIDALEKVQQTEGRKTYTILQLRHHEAIVALKKKIENGPKDKIYDIDLTYITSRGNWYYASWKGDEHKSGGIATNIGVHFYDMLCWIFGEVKQNIVHISTHDRVAGFLQLKNANVRYFLSIDGDTLPKEVAEKGGRSYRCIMIDGEELEFTNGFTDLHTVSYQKILNGEGFEIGESRNAINTVYEIRNAQPIGLVGDYHPLAKLACKPHPFKWRF